MERNIHFGYLFATLGGMIVLVLSELTGVSRLEADVTLGRLILVLIFGQLLGYVMYYAVRYIDRLTAWGPWSLGILYGLVLWVLVLPIASASTIIAPIMTKGAPTIISSLVAFMSYGVVVSNYTMLNIDV